MGYFGKQWVFLKKAMFFYTTSHMIYFDYKAYAFYQNKKLFMFYIKFLFITQSLIEVTVLLSMLFKKFDKFSSVLHFSTLKLPHLVVENHCVFLAHIFWNCAFFPQKCAWKTQNADQKISLIYMILHLTLILNKRVHLGSTKCQKISVLVCVR